jgi:hypothetical protein
MMSSDFPTLSEIGERNLRERAERTGEPVDYFENYVESKYERGA